MYGYCGNTLHGPPLHRRVAKQCVGAGCLGKSEAILGSLTIMQTIQVKVVVVHMQRLSDGTIDEPN